MLVIAAAAANAQTTGARTDSIAIRPGTTTTGKTAVATRVSDGAVNVDGRIDEAVWQTTAPLTDFVQKEPVEGSAPTNQLEVRFVYDDDALYVATRVLSKNPSGIQAPVTRRDNINQADHIWISLDSYRDRRTAYSFGISASGVRADWYHPSDDETNVDMSFDPVWEAAADRNTTGWTSEMRIPFSQLRFNASDVQTWGLNVDHWMPATNEDVFWIPTPRKETGWSSRMGTLTGIRGIKPSRRLELMPYVATEARMTGDRDRRNPFDDGRNLGARVGGDVKMGLGPSLTLQATVNPDFGQVEADPAEVNLSAFETFFSERRPFFIEGNEILRGAGSFFYSRRIGARPRSGAIGDYVDYPDASTILGAAKLTGRLASGVSIGALTAVTSREQARTHNLVSGAFADTLVAPLVAYAVTRVQKEYGAAASTIGLTLTGVQRDISSGEPLSRLLNKSAYSGAVNVNHRIWGGMYSVDAQVGFSHITGDSTAILGAQRSSARYYQRPDAESYELDPSRTSLSGLSGYLDLGKNSGRHWLGGLFVGTESPGYELNDLGRLGTADGITGVGYVRYRETQPGKYLRSYGVQTSHENEWNYDRDRQFGAIRADADATFKNFWRLDLTAWHDVRSQNARQTRGGPLMQTPYNDVAIISLGNSSASKTQWTARVYYGKDEFGAPTNRISGSISIRPAPQWQIRFEPNYLRAVDSRQFVTSLAGGPGSTFDRRYVFRVHRPERVLLQPSVQLHVASRRFSRALRTTLRCERPLLRFRTAEGGTQSRPAALRPGWNEHRAAIEQQLSRNRRDRIRRTARDVHAPQQGFQRRVGEKQLRCALGISSRQYPVRRLAAESRGLRRARRAGACRRSVSRLFQCRYELFRRQSQLLDSGPVSVRGGCSRGHTG